MPKVNYICFTYHTRAGFSGGGAFSGRFRGVRAGSIRQTVVLWIVGGRAGVLFRACGRGGMPPPFFARAQSLRVYSLIVFGG